MRPPRPPVPAHRVVATGIALEPQCLEDPLERQPLALAATRVLLEHRIEPRRKGPELGQWLIQAAIVMLRRLAANDAAHRVPGEPKLAGYPLDPLALDQKCVPDPPDRLHRHHPPLRPRPYHIEREE